MGRKVGLLGGTFDPVHLGHLALAHTARRELSLDSILFMPAAVPPHKQGSACAPMADRLAMLRLAVQEDSFFHVSSLEAERSGPSYSVDTLSQLRTLMPGVVFFFIIGIDAFAEITTWKEYRELFMLTDFVVAGRPPQDVDLVANVLDRAHPGYAFDALQGVWRHPKVPARIHLLAMEPVELSSTDIRRRLAEGKAVSNMVPPAVEEYISTSGLYRH